MESVDFTDHVTTQIRTNVFFFRRPGNVVSPDLSIPADLKSLKALVRQGEGMHLEFKLKATHPEKIVREIVAFANAEGGLLLVGVGDDRSVPGVKFADEDEYILTRAIAVLLPGHFLYLPENSRHRRKRRTGAVHPTQ